MKKSKFTDAQIAFVLRLAEGARAAGHLQKPLVMSTAG